MFDWDSTLYLKFKQQRTQPAIDLVARLKEFQPESIIDLGCGPGNSTAVLKTSFPNAHIIGIDNSANMISKAKSEHPELEFQLCDVHDIPLECDMIFSNACLHWIPKHAELLPELISKLSSGGVLAVQVPCNEEEPLYRIVAEMAKDSKWEFHNLSPEISYTLSSDEYIEILSDCTSSFDIWETVYYHVLPSHQALINWIKGSRLRPYLSALSCEQAVLFEKEILECVEAEYPITKNNSVILRFKRLFFVAEK